MKRFQIAALFLALGILLLGCQNSQSAQPTPAASPSLSHFESYVSQTAFSFPKSWQYQEDEDYIQGLTAAFTFTGGTVGIQFVWLSDQQAKSNVFLQQIEMDDVQEQALSAGPYAGKLISGVQSGAYTIAYEGSRSWYDTAPRLFMRVVLQAADQATFTKERGNLLAMLGSVTIQTDANPPAIDMTQLDTYDFKSDFGFSIKTPQQWMLQPEGDAEHETLTLSFSVQSGDNTYRTELATVTRTEFDAVIKSLKDLEKYDDVYNYTFAQSGGISNMTCLQEGKINRVSVMMQKVGSRYRYLWVSSKLRPMLDAAYYQSVIVPINQSILWKK